MFIDNKRFSELRSKAGSGDETARKILLAFRNDDPGVSKMIDEYFKPAEEPKVEVEGMDRKDMSRLEKFLADNNVKEGDEDYDEYVAEFNNMFPTGEKKEVKEVEIEPEHEPEEECGCDGISIEDLIDDENEAVEGYDEFILQVVNDTEIKEDKKALILSKLKKIKDEEIEHINILQEMSKEFPKPEGMIDSADEEDELL